MIYTFTADEAATITQAVHAADAQAIGEDRPLELTLVANTHDRPWPLWLAMCHAVLVEGSFQPDDSLDLVAEALTRHGLRFGEKADIGFSPSFDTPAIAPHRAAALALGVGHPGHDHAATPATAEEALLVDLFEGRWPPAQARQIRLTQLLVSPWRGAEHRGRLCVLECWLLPGPAAAQPTPGHPLLRAPGAALMPVDDDFGEGLAQVPRLLAGLLRPGAPALAWNLRPQVSTDEPAPPGLASVEGRSATAALAVASLWLLRDWLDTSRPELAALVEWLDDAEPATLTITAALDGPAAEPAPFRWPRLVRVGGVGDKLAALKRAPPEVVHRYMAHDQMEAAVPGQPEKEKPIDLARLIERIARDADPALDDNARSLRRQLVDGTPEERARIDMKLLSDVARCRQRPRTVPGYLLWRYAVRASGSHAAFGDPVRLDRHFVRLVLEADARPGDDDDEPTGRAQAAASKTPPQPLTLDLLLDTHPHNAVSAWCVVSPPFRGKTTLLAKREADQAVKALTLRRTHGRWGEVCVFLPMRSLQLGRTRSNEPAKVVQCFVDFIDEQAPGLPRLAERLALQGREAPQDGLQWRLLIDGLNELRPGEDTPAGTHDPAARDAARDERRAVVEILCDWLARHQAPDGPLLPPVFTVRTLENGFNLAARTHPAWRAELATLQPWQRDDWREYIEQRQLEPQAARRLHEALRTDLTVDHPDQDTPFQDFCRTPGILAAQCTLLARWPDLVPPQRRGRLFLALLWHCLDERGKGLPSALLPEHLRGTEALKAARQRDWRLPDEPGILLQLLMRQADAMQDEHGLPAIEAALANTPPGAAQDPATARAWRDAVSTLGLGALNFNGRFSFVHQQWQEFFAALGCGLERGLPKLDPPKLDPPSGQPLLDHLASKNGELRLHLLSKNGELRLPRVTEHHERMRFAVELADDPAAWLRRLIPLNLPLAAQCAIDVKDQLEPDDAWPGEHLQGPDPVLQHIRRLLLLRSMDAGEAVRDKLRAAALIGDDTDQAALAEHMPGFGDEALNAHWREVWAGKCRGEGVDIRERIQAGLLLGQLTDTLRFTLVEAELPDGSVRRGTVPRLHQWALHGEPGGPALAFRVGTDPDSEVGDDDERPAWLPDLDPFGIARYPVTVGEWQWFMRQKDRREAPAYEPSAPWWQRAGAAAQTWLRKRLEENPDGGQRPWVLGNEDYANPLQPMTTITWHEARAYAAWVEPLHRALERQGWDARRLEATEAWRSRVPTEVRWEAGVRGPARPGQAPRHWAHQTTPTGHASATGGRTPDPGPLDINHDSTNYWQSSPIGCFSVGTTAVGVVDAEGQVWEWCANELPVKLRERGYGDVQAQAVADQEVGPEELEPGWVALRGGSYDNSAGHCHSAYREHHLPRVADDYVGLRLVRCVLPHSGH